MTKLTMCGAKPQLWITSEKKVPRHAPFMNHEPPADGMISAMAKRGGQRMISGRDISYDPETTVEPWRPPASFQPAQARKLIEAMRDIHPRLSVGGFLDVLVRLVPTHEQDPALTWAVLKRAVEAEIEATALSTKADSPLPEAITE